MLNHLIKTIQDSKRPEILTHEDRTYLLDSYNPLKEPTCSPLIAHTLTGIMDYLHAKVDSDHIKTPHVIHITNFDYVQLITELFGAWKQRDEVIIATTHDSQDIDGRWMDVASFILTLKTQFAQNEGKDHLIKIISGIPDVAARELTDNGITQSSAVKSEDYVELKCPVILKPYRTFTEIEQPDIQFVFRTRNGNFGTECALFESDGDLWKSETIRKIKAWFEEQMADTFAISVIA